MNKNYKNGFTIEQTISLEKVSNLIISALEGGSNYWYMIQKEIKPVTKERIYLDSIWDEQRKKNPNWLSSVEIVFNGGALMIDDSMADDPELKEPIRFDLECIQKGLEVWQADVQSGGTLHGSESADPSHWADFIGGNDDQTTADVFLQYCIFGKVIYG